MDESMASEGDYWCHLCSQIVSPVMELEMKCPYCDSGFVEEVSSAAGGDRGLRQVINDEEDDDEDLGTESDQSLSLLGPILLGMMGGRARRRRSRLLRLDDESDSDQDRDLEDLLRARSWRRRRRRSSAIRQLLQGLHDGIGSEGETTEMRDREREERERERERERESLILINPVRQTIVLQGSIDSDSAEGGHDSNSSGVAASLGDYLIGPGLDMLLQHLAENDLNRYGTPPAKKEAIDAMPTVKVEENLNCSVCLDDFEFGTEAKEMPCKHKFHSGCILPWLELHSSCPVCRFQIPADELKVSDATGTGTGSGTGTGDGGRDRASGSRSSIPWTLREIFSTSGSRRARNPSSSSSSSENNSHDDEN